MKKAYASVYNEDEFEGISVPFVLHPVLNLILENTEDLIDSVFDNYEEYRNYEVECSHYAKDGSSGTTDLNNAEEFKKWFFSRFDIRIDSDRVPQRMINLINNLEDTTQENKSLSDEEAKKILDELIDGLQKENDEFSHDERTQRLLPKIINQLTNFRDNWFDYVV